jgi:transposase InsO family protein
LANHLTQVVAADFFVVPTATYRLLFVLVILVHERRRIVHVAVTEHPTAAWTAQQLRNAFIERFIGSVRRECLDHVIILSGVGLRRVLADYIDYYTRARMHLSLQRTQPAPRPVTPTGRVVAIPTVNGLHHRYTRIAA